MTRSKSDMSEQPSGNLRHTAAGELSEFLQTVPQPADCVPVRFQHIQEDAFFEAQRAVEPRNLFPGCQTAFKNVQVTASNIDQG